MLVVSPFLGAGRLSEIVAGTYGNILVSRPEEIAAISPDVRARFTETLVLNDVVEPEPSGDESETSEPLPGGELRGLHAKLYVSDEGWDARVWTGSANATTAAFSRNVEFLVELAGRKRVCGVDRILGRPDDPSLRSLLIPFEPPDEALPLADDLDWKLREIAAAIGSAPVRAHVRLRDDDGFDVELRADRKWKPPWPAEAAVRCWPVTLAAAAFATPLERGSGPLARFARVPLTALTTFYAVEVSFGSGKAARRGRFVARWPLVGAPEGRTQAVLMSLLDNPERLLAFFRLMLAEPADAEEDGGAPARLSLGMVGAADEVAWVVSSEPLLEALVRTLEADPGRLKAIASIVEEFRGTAEGRTRIPEGFLEIWEPVWEAYERSKAVG